MDINNDAAIQQQDAQETGTTAPVHRTPTIPYTRHSALPPTRKKKKLITIWYGFSQRLTIGLSTALATKTQSTVDGEGPIKGTKFSIRLQSEWPIQGPAIPQ